MNRLYDFVDDHPWLIFVFGSLVAVVNFALGLVAGMALRGEQAS